MARRGLSALDVRVGATPSKSRHFAPDFAAWVARLEQPGPICDPIPAAFGPGAAARMTTSPALEQWRTEEALPQGHWKCRAGKRQR